MVKGVTAKIATATTRYNAARAALAALSPILKDSEWQTSLRVLHAGDIRSMTDLMAGETEGTRALSWIWKVHGAAKDDSDKEGSLDAMRIEWCKAQARVHRWKEEVELLKEEMRRTEAFLEWHANWWDNQAKVDKLPVSSDRQVVEGLVAYAKRQATLRRSLKDHFNTRWKSTRAYLDVIDGDETGSISTESPPELLPGDAPMEVDQDSDIE
jgi:hypothetical protein